MKKIITRKEFDTIPGQCRNCKVRKCTEENCHVFNALHDSPEEDESICCNCGTNEAVILLSDHSFECTACERKWGYYHP